MFRLALCQMMVTAGRKQENLERALGLIAAAKAEGAQVVLFPEAMDLGWCMPASHDEAEGIPDGLTCQTLSRAARKYGIWICSGLVETHNGHLYNAAVLMDASGRIVLRHRKINAVEVEQEVYGPGDGLNTCPTPFGTFGLMICADATAKEQVLARALCHMGADVILSPTAWAVEPEYDNLKTPYGSTWTEAYAPVCREFAVWIAGCSNVGRLEHGAWKGWKCIGNSLVVDPKGRVALQGPYGENAEKVLFVDVEPMPRPARGTGWNTWWSRQEEQEKDYSGISRSR